MQQYLFLKNGLVMHFDGRFFKPGVHTNTCACLQKCPEKVCGSDLVRVAIVIKIWGNAGDSYKGHLHKEITRCRIFLSSHSFTFSL